MPRLGKALFILVLCMVSKFVNADVEINQQLFQVYTEGQTDRKNNVFYLYRDEDRLELVKELMKAGQLKHAKDFYHAAMIHQHSRKSQDYKIANQLALKSVELNPEDIGSKWLACAAEDRYLQSIGEPQIWGTQYKGPRGERTMQPFDENAKTDEQRALCGVPSLEKIKARLQKMNKSGN